jgi:hypothetical protein
MDVGERAVSPSALTSARRFRREAQLRTLEDKPVYDEAPFLSAAAERFDRTEAYFSVTVMICFGAILQFPSLFHPRCEWLWYARLYRPMMG